MLYLSPMKHAITIWLALILFGCGGTAENTTENVSEAPTANRGFHAFVTHGKQNIALDLVKEDSTYSLFYSTGIDEWGLLQSNDLLTWVAQPSVPTPFAGLGAVVQDANNTAGLNARWIAAICDGKQIHLSYTIDGIEWVNYEDNPVLSASGFHPAISWDRTFDKWVLTLVESKEVKLYSSSNLIDWEEGAPIAIETETTKAQLINVDDGWKLMLLTDPISMISGTFDGTSFYPGDADSYEMLANGYGAILQDNEELILLTNSTISNVSSTFSTPMRVHTDAEGLRLMPASSLKEHFTSKRRGRLRKLLSDGPSWYQFALEDEYESLKIMLSNPSSNVSISWNKGDDELVVDRTNASLGEEALDVFNVPIDLRSINSIDLLIDHKLLDVYFNDGEHVIDVPINPQGFLYQTEVFFDGKRQDLKAVLYDIGI